MDREALASVLAGFGETEWDSQMAEWERKVFYEQADHVIASGILRDAAEVRAEVIDWIKAYKYAGLQLVAQPIIDQAREHFGIEEHR